MQLLESVPFTIRQGDDFSAEILLTDEEGNFTDLTNAEFRGEVRDSASDSTVRATIQIIPKDLPNGLFAISLSAEVTSQLPIFNNTGATKPVREFAYDLVMVLDGESTTILEGVMTVLQRVTR